MDDNRDRYGDKLRDVEKAREDQWAHDNDQRLLERLRQRQSADRFCPECKAKLVARIAGGIAMLACPENHGAWLDHEALEHLPKADSANLGRGTK